MSRPEAGSSLVPAAGRAGGRDRPLQWPRPGREAGGRAAGPAGRIFPPRRRRRRGRYHGDRGGRLPPGAREDGLWLPTRRPPSPTYGVSGVTLK